MIKKIYLLFAFLLLAACNQASNVHTERTRDWYMQHDAERKTRVPECQNDAAQMASPDCQNAVAAQSQITVFGK